MRSLTRQKDRNKMIQKDTIKVKENDGQRKKNGKIFWIFAVNRSRFFPVLLAVRRSLGPSSRPQPIMASAQGSRGSPPPWPREVGCPLSLPALLRYSLFPPWNLWLCRFLPILFANSVSPKYGSTVTLENHRFCVKVTWQGT